jgi:hypothetical protein
VHEQESSIMAYKSSPCWTNSNGALGRVASAKNPARANLEAQTDSPEGTLKKTGLSPSKCMHDTLYAVRTDGRVGVEGQGYTRRSTQPTCCCCICEHLQMLFTRSCATSLSELPDTPWQDTGPTRGSAGCSMVPPSPRLPAIVACSEQRVTSVWRPWSGTEHLRSRLPHVPVRARTAPLFAVANTVKDCLMA